MYANELHGKSFPVLGQEIIKEEKGRPLNK